MSFVAILHFFLKLDDEEDKKCGSSSTKRYLALMGTGVDWIFLIVTVVIRLFPSFLRYRLCFCRGKNII